MQVVPLQCPLCTGLIQIDRARAGQQVACPLCQQTIQLPPAEFFAAPSGPPTPPELPPTMPADLVQMACPVCAGWLAVPAAMSGQQVACPHCASPILIGPVAPPPTEHPAPTELPVPHTFEAAPTTAVSAGSTGKSPTTAPVGHPAGRDRLPPPSHASERLPPQPTDSPVSDRLPPGMPSPAPRADRLPPGSGGIAKPTSERLPPSRWPEQPVHKPQAGASDAPATSRDSGSPSRAEPSPAPAIAAVPPPDDQASAAPDIAALLPPGAEDWQPAAEDQPAPETPKRSKRSIEELLPPGADGSPGVMPGERVEVPEAPRRRRAIAANLPKGTVAVPTPDGGFVTVTESPTVIGEGDEEIEVRRLTPEEKARRRFRRNLILWSISILILLAVTWWLVGR